MNRRHVPAPFRCLLLGLLTSAAIAGEVLYNGIELPAPWPPARTAAELKSGEPMPVPYLKQPPAVIPIDVGRQLFMDDFLIESATLRRRFHQPEYHPRSPVLKAEMDWKKDKEGEWAGAYSDGVWHDAKTGMFSCCGIAQPSGRRASCSQRTESPEPARRSISSPAPTKDR